MRLGLHLLLDGKVSKVLTSKELKAVLPELARFIGMTPMGKPITRDCSVGPSAIQFIIESHIAVNYIHNYIAADVFSCKDFDTGATAEKLIEVFCISEVTKRLILERGFV